VYSALTDGAIRSVVSRANSLTWSFRLMSVGPGDVVSVGVAPSIIPYATPAAKSLSRGKGPRARKEAGLSCL